MGKKTKLVKVKYEGVLELSEEVDGIAPTLNLTCATLILINGVNSVMVGPKVVRAHGAKYTVGTWVPSEKKTRRKTT